MNIITYPYSGEARHVYSLLTAFITVSVLKFVRALCGHCLDLDVFPNIYNCDPD